MVEIDPIDEIYKKAEYDPTYRKELNKNLDAFGMPWLKAPEPKLEPKPTGESGE